MEIPVGGGTRYGQGLLKYSWATIGMLTLLAKYLITFPGEQFTESMADFWQQRKVKVGNGLKTRFWLDGPCRE